ncbi:hypothetical protein OPV22_032158 [Ensete ventricosum]|uniref:Vacuolar import/degradation Vid27 C-terminal domain-containing protein n=1 Tax=Ensete ventricosum TaxID=4639 RepID=A0AAV8PUM8_ENSVE|nr:hypothetical protein OPV22_032158 [Ensete ventricosum]
MAGSHSREVSGLSDSDEEEGEAQQQQDQEGTGHRSGETLTRTCSLDDVDRKLQSLKLDYTKPYSSPSPSSQNSSPKNSVKLYLHVGGNSPTARWVVSDKLASWAFFRPSLSGESDGEDESPFSSPWFLGVGAKFRVRIAPELQLKSLPDLRRVDFIAEGVWSIKFPTLEGYREFQNQYQSCLFENTYGFVANEENKVKKVFGKDFMAWVRPEAEEDSIWAEAEGRFDKSPGSLATPTRFNHQDLLEEVEEAAHGGGIQSLVLGALDNSFLVSDYGIQVLGNFNHGVRGKGISVNVSRNSGEAGRSSAPTKALLMKAETNMLLLSPAQEGKSRATGVHQLDIKTGKVVTEWKFEKDGTNITMQDIANDSKGAQLDPSESTFLGLDDNTLCRWDMRDQRGIVQSIATEMESPVLQWTQGHHFSKGTNFKCFATTGDGSIVVGSVNGKIRLYSGGSLRVAKTAFPGLGSPITHVDVTFDGKWVLGTTDTYIILISTVFKDNDGREMTGFSGRRGHRIAAPRLLKLSPLDSHLAGTNSKFRGGKFSWVTDNGKLERHMVAAYGKFSVIWNFQQVKNSNHECYKNQEGLKSCYCYKIIPKDESIVDNRFMHEKFAVNDSPEAPLVVATPTKVSSFSTSSGRH